MLSGKNVLNKLIQENKSTLLSIFSKLSLEELNKQAKVSEGFKEIVEPLILSKMKALSAPVLSSDLTKYALEKLLPFEDKARLSQTNHFFKHSMTKALSTEKSKLLNDFNVEVNNLLSKMQSDERGHFWNHEESICQFIKKFFNKSYQIFSRTDFPELMVAHARELSFTDIYRFNNLSFFINNNNNNYQIILTWDAPNYTMSGVDYLIKVYQKFYPNIKMSAVFQQSPQLTTSFGVRFDLEEFLKTILPVIKGISKTPMVEESKYSYSR